MRALIASVVAVCGFSVGLVGQDTPTTVKNTQYGHSCQDSSILFWLSAPARGKTVECIIDVYDDGSKASVAWMALGFTKDHLRIGTSNGEACWLLVGPSWITPIPLFQGRASLNLFRCPTDPAIKGLPLFAQLLHHSTSRGLAMSRGIAMSVQ